MQAPQSQDGQERERTVSQSATLEFTAAPGAATDVVGDFLATEWALRGHGVIMRSDWQIRPHLDSGALVRVLPDVPTPPADIYALRPGDAHVPRRVAELVKHLAARLPDRIAGAPDHPLRPPPPAR